MAVKVPDANPPMPEFRDDYVMQEVNEAWLSQQVKPKQFISIDESECILCEGCVDICPWKCIWLVKPEAITNLEEDGESAFIIDDDVCTRCSLCVDRCPTGVITLGRVYDGHEVTNQRTNSHGYAYGVREIK